MLQIPQIFPLGFWILKQSALSLPTHTVRIADGLLCTPSVEVSNYQLTKFTYICRLLSTP